MNPTILLSEPLAKVVDEKAMNDLRQLGELRVSPSSSEEVLSNEIIDADALITRTAVVTRTIIESSRRLKVIGRTGTGVDNIDLAAATERGIYVVNVPLLNAQSVAEHTFALILALAKNLFRFDSELRSGNPKIRDELLPYNFELAGKTIGIIGLGAVGIHVARVAKDLGLRVLAFDPYVTPDKFKEASADHAELDTLLENSDFVTIHVPLNTKTRHLIGEHQINLMKKDSFLINCARGGVVDEIALSQALHSRKIAGAGVDVFEKEFDASNVLYSNDNVIVTPHVAGQTREARSRIMDSLVSDIRLVLTGGVPINIVNKEVARLQRI